MPEIKRKKEIPTGREGGRDTEGEREEERGRGREAVREG